MAGADSKSVRHSRLGAPREVVLMIVAALGAFIAIGCGSLLAGLAPAHSNLLYAAAYIVPALAALLAFRLIAPRL